MIPLVSRSLASPFRVFILGAALLALTPAAQAQNIKDLTVSEFEKLHKELQPAEEAWRELPWHTSILEARVQAVKEKKPLYMLVRSGHPLGCV